MTDLFRRSKGDSALAAGKKRRQKWRCVHMREIVWKGWGGEERFREKRGGGVKRRGRRERERIT